MRLPQGKPTMQPPTGPQPSCCRHKSITVPPDFANKARQKHDYLTAEWHPPTGAESAPNEPSLESKTAPVRT